MSIFNNLKFYIVVYEYIMENILISIFRVPG